MKTLLKTLTLLTTGLVVGVAVKRVYDKDESYEYGCLSVREKKDVIPQIHKFLSEEKREYVAHEFVPKSNRVFLIHK